MTHPVDVVARSLELASSGRSATEVARLVGVPRATVRDWMRGRVPRRTMLKAGAACVRCGARHDFDALGPSYVYLLGLYLGDGCLSAHPRGVFKLRILLDARYPDLVRECEDAMRELMPRSRLTG
jgi:hypothetical protein